MEFLLGVLEAAIGFLVASGILTAYAVYRGRKMRKVAEARLREFEEKIASGDIDPADLLRGVNG